MALFTIPAIAKGETQTITLNKVDLLALAPVAADAYFSDGDNIKKVIVEWNSDPGNQRRRLQFDFTVANPSAEFSVSEKARDDFLLESIMLIDFDGGQFVISGNDLPSGFDINTASGGGGSLPVTSGLYSWFRGSSVLVADGAPVTTWTDESGSVGATNMLQNGGNPAPTLVASSINGLPALRNNLAGNSSAGSARHLKMARAFPTNSSTVFVVAKGAVGAINRGALYSEQDDFGDGSTALALTHKADNVGKPLWAYYSQPFAQPELTPAVGENPFIVGTVCNYNVSIQQYLNGALSVTTSGGAMAAFRKSSVFLFNFFSYNFRGEIAEFIIYDRALTGPEIASVFSYLGTKYAITVT